ncbi:MAG: multifunctional CCA tRNA nucleotidyl transferase/2'3'-cyclic phosphodiesterase/2'nucleotidase/phosphatase [Gammaproteobacteria bacterium]
MEVYLVGGAVRDELLGLPITERDWVVVGASPEQMELQGYKAIGKDFPVFLHPESKEEYALARTERKKGRGYHGFEVHASPDVTLEEDLHRRDLTINAMAKSETNVIIDPYGGQQDLKDKVLRHVSDAFTEDPLRVLRVARFVAKFHNLGFSIAEETQQLMRHIVNTREIDDLSPERIWQETYKALSMPSPEQFFLVLYSVNALSQTHPSINNEFSNQPSRDLALAALKKLAKEETDACMRLASMLGGLYFQQADNSHQEVKTLCEKLILPKACKELLLLTVLYQHSCHNVFELDKNQLLELLRGMDAKRKPERFIKLLKIFSIIHQSTSSADDYLQADFIKLAAKTIENIDIEPWIKAKISQQELADNIHNAQQVLLDKLIQERNA